MPKSSDTYFKSVTKDIIRKEILKTGNKIAKSAKKTTMVEKYLELYDEITQTIITEAIRSKEIRSIRHKSKGDYVGIEFEDQDYNTGVAFIVEKDKHMITIVVEQTTSFSLDDVLVGSSLEFKHDDERWYNEEYDCYLIPNAINDV